MHRHFRMPVIALAGLIVAGFIGAGCQDKNKEPAEAPLWDRLGGEKAVRTVVADFVARAAADEKVNFLRKGTPAEVKPTPADLERLQQRLVEFISAASGGPLKYTGKSMPDAHKGMKITSAEFDALAGDLKASLEKFGVKDREKDELLTAVAGTKKDIVGK